MGEENRPQKPNILRKKISRRKALSTAGKVALGCVVTGVVAGVAGYYIGSAYAPTVTKTVRSTVTAPAGTVTKTVTHTTTVTHTATVSSAFTAPTYKVPPEPTTPIKLTFWKWQAIALTDKRIEEVVNMWNKEHPNVQIEFTVFPELSEPEFIAKVEKATQAGRGPDIIHTSDCDAVTMAYNGDFAVIPDEIQALIRQYLEPPFDDIFFKTVLSLWGPDMVRRPYVFPGFRGASAKLGWVNEYHLKEIGYPADWDPTDWDELVDTAKKLTKYDTAGNLVRSGLFLRIGGHAGGIFDKFGPLFMSAGGRVLWAEGGKWHTDLDSDIARKTVQLYLDVLYKYKIYQPGFPGDATGFANEQCSMILPREAPEVIPVCLKVKPEKFKGPEGPKGFHPYAVPPAEKGLPSKTWLDLHAIGVNAKSPPEKQRWAFHFLGWLLTNKEARMKLYNEIGQWMPYRDIINEKPFNLPMYKKLTELTKTGTSRLLHPLMAMIMYDGGKVLSRIFLKEIEVDKGLKELARVVLEHANKVPAPKA